jgi:hypothetical protein
LKTYRLLIWRWQPKRKRTERRRRERQQREVAGERGDEERWSERESEVAERVGKEEGLARVLRT